MKEMIGDPLNVNPTGTKIFISFTNGTECVTDGFGQA